jgi:hypothetical protein
MQTDYSVFQERLAAACLTRNITEREVFRSIGLGGRKTMSFGRIGVRALDLPWVCQIADALDVSLDWLMGRSNLMEVMEMPELSEPRPPKKKRSKATG